MTDEQRVVGMQEPWGKPCAACGKPVNYPATRYADSAFIFGDRVWHTSCVPACGISGTFTINGNGGGGMRVETPASRERPAEPTTDTVSNVLCRKCGNVMDGATSLCPGGMEKHVADASVPVVARPPLDYCQMERAFVKWLDARPAGYNGDDLANPGGRWFDAFHAGAMWAHGLDVTPKMKLPRYRHLKRGTEYNVEDRGTVQCEVPVKDGDELLAYRGDDGRLWFRPPAEFHDGRFERVDGQPKVGDPT